MYRFIIYFFVAAFVMISQVFAQQMEDVVYLKNGGVIRGNIVEQIPSQSLKIQTRDGNVLVYSMDEIAKISKEPVIMRGHTGVQKERTEQFTPSTTNPTAISAQEDRARKLAQIDREIAAAERTKRNGIILFLLGVGAQAGGWYAFAPEIDLYTGDISSGSEGLWQAAIWGGFIAEVWGAWKWWDGAQTASRLKAKRYDLSMGPKIKLDSDGDPIIAFGLKVSF